MTHQIIDHRLIASLLPLLALSKYEPALKTSITDTAKAIQRSKINEKSRQHWRSTNNCIAPAF